MVGVIKECGKENEFYYECGQGVGRVNKKAQIKRVHKTFQILHFYGMKAKVKVSVGALKV